MDRLYDKHATCGSHECGRLAFVTTERACLRCCCCLAVITEHQVSTATADCIACMIGDHCAAKSAACTFVFEADEQCSGQASEHKSILGAVLADCRHVHNWQQLFDVVQQQLVEQALITLLQGSEVAVPVQIIGHVAYIDESTVCLQVSCPFSCRSILLHSAICAVESLLL